MTIPSEFRLAAKQGTFVYCYLRSTQSPTAKAGTPYYIGISSSPDRPFHKNHNAPVPKDRSCVRIMRSGLSWEEACRWERFYIQRLGRVDNGSGILRNLTDGGEGAFGAVRTEEQRARYSAASTGRKHSELTRQKLSAARKGQPLSVETKEQISQSLTGRTFSDAHREAIGDANRKRVLSDSTKALIAEKAKGRKIPQVASANAARVWDDAARKRHSEAMRLAAARRKANAALSA